MLKVMKVFVLFFGFFLVFIPLPLSAASAPAGVNNVLEEMSELEEGFEAEKWQEANESVEKIEKELNEIFAQSNLNDSALIEVLASLKKYVIEQNEKQVEVNYIRFQKHFFNFISQFDYDVHPILGMIQKYVIDESSEAYEKKDYDDVMSEMREAGNLIDHAKPLLVEKGIAEQEVNDFKSKVIALIMAGKKKDYAKMGELLEELKITYGSFLTRYKQK